MSGRASDGDVAAAGAAPAVSVAKEKPIAGVTKECMKRAGLPEGVAVPELTALTDTRVGYAQPAGKDLANDCSTTEDAHPTDSASYEGGDK